MKYTDEMILRSPSGYAMPFYPEEGNDIDVIARYGAYYDKYGTERHNPGVDFKMKFNPLYAIASGSVMSVGHKMGLGNYVSIKYGRYLVTYARLGNIYTNFGDPVVAMQAVALSTDRLHIEVSFDGNELDPIEFLTMLYGNVKATAGNGGIDIQQQGLANGYENDANEIIRLMIRYLPKYFESIQSGSYVIPSHTEHLLRNIFSQSIEKGYFFEGVPSLYNPLGMKQRSASVAAKVQNLLITDFLNFLALKYRICLSTAPEDVKKNFSSIL